MSRRFNKPTTTVDYRQRPNLIKHLPAANAWSMDITYLKLSNGQWVYLASTLDLRTHKILAHQISATLDTKLVVTTLQRALLTHKNQIIYTLIWAVSSLVLALKICYINTKLSIRIQS
ncbi:DDE-type integrase/transposase/recombinase [Leuconostoc carnosum]|uniref:DDE-type integrase/transposase/recombinase n=1 Tax=Leuconostoc carnosum TaxID=1252 RepID=UPI0038855E11